MIRAFGKIRSVVVEHAGAAVIAAWLLIIFGSVASAQSTLRDFPTAITSNEVSGTIAPRALGDSRITTYYYYFNGNQGDIFINLVTENFSGDIDVFSFDGVRLLTRVVVLPDSEPVETGRVVYLRQPEKLLIRIQGRTPNDEPAKFRLKFAGSFLAVNESDASPVPELPTVPKPVIEEKPVEIARAGEVEPAEPKESPRSENAQSVPAESRVSKPEVTITDPTAAVTSKKEADLSVRPPERSNERTRDQRRTRNVPPAAESEPAKGVADRPAAPKEADPMENFGLVIIFKDGSKISRPMTEVLRFTIDRGVLTVIGKDGRIGRYSMRDVERVGIE